MLCNELPPGPDIGQKDWLDELLLRHNSTDSSASADALGIEDWLDLSNTSPLPGSGAVQCQRRSTSLPEVPGARNKDQHFGQYFTDIPDCNPPPFFLGEPLRSNGVVDRGWDPSQQTHIDVRAQNGNAAPAFPSPLYGVPQTGDLGGAPATSGFLPALHSVVSSGTASSAHSSLEASPVVLPPVLPPLASYPAASQGALPPACAAPPALYYIEPPAQQQQGAAPLSRQNCGSGCSEWAVGQGGMAAACPMPQGRKWSPPAVSLGLPDAPGGPPVLSVGALAPAPPRPDKVSKRGSRVTYSGRPGLSVGEGGLLPPSLLRKEGPPVERRRQPEVSSPEEVQELVRGSYTKKRRMDQLATLHMLRGTICGEDQEGALPLALKYMESEQKRLELHKLASRIQMETNPCPVAYQEVNEVKVNGLIHSLHRLRARGRPLSDSLPEVMEIVSCINDVRGNQLVGVNSFISTQFAKECASYVPPFVARKGAPREYRVVLDALQYAAGTKAAGEAVLQLAFGSAKGCKVKIKDVGHAARDICSQHFAECIPRATRLLKEVAEARQEDERKKAMDALGLAVAEVAIIDHLFYVNNPQRVRNIDHWVQSSQLPDESKRQAMIRAAGAIVRGGGDLSKMKKTWDQHCKPLAEYEARSRALRDEVAAILPSFSMQDPLAETSYRALLDTVAALQRSLDQESYTKSAAITRTWLELEPFQLLSAMVVSFPHGPEIALLCSLKPEEYLHAGELPSAFGPQPLS